MTFIDKKSLREKYGELIQGSNLTSDLVDHVIIQKKKILIIDNYRIGKPQNPFEIRKKYIQEHMIEFFHEKFPDLDLVLYFDGEISPEAIADRIVTEKISYVFSCIGMKEQEIRLVQIFEYISRETPVV
jgi:hypothetical protein